MSSIELPDDPMVEVTADQHALATKAISDLGFAISTIRQGLTSEAGLSLELAQNCLKVSEFYVRDLCKALGIETNGAKEMDERNAALREANQRIRDLEQQLGCTQNPKLTQLAVKALADRVKGWWDLEGFGHVSDFQFGGYGVTLKLSCTLFGRFLLIDSSTPVSDRESKARWYADLTARGFVLVVERGEREPSLDDCDASRLALRQLIMDRMPSATITRFENQGVRGNHVLRSVEVFVRDYDDLANLPIPEKEADSDA